MPRFPCWSGQSGTRPQLFRVRLLTTSLLRVYGGGFWGGASLRFDSGDLVAQSVERGTPVVFVSFNYRVGPLGFPQGNEMDKKGLLNVGACGSLLGFE